MASNIAKETSYEHPSSGFVNVDGVIHFRGVSNEFLGFIKNLPVKSEDVFVATYPKSGTTWVGEIANQIYNDGQIHLGLRPIFLDSLPLFKNMTSKEELDEAYNNHHPRVYKTHLRYHELPMGDGRAVKPKYIYVVRNPKDVAVSYYHHYKGIKIYEFGDRSWDEFFSMFISNEVHYGSWFDHVNGWWAHRDDSNILFLKYEDMKKDLPGTVQQIAKFIGKDISPEMMEKIASQTTFKAMSADPDRFITKELHVPDDKFVRKGEVDDWKNYFTEEQNKVFEELIKTKMMCSGLEFDN